MMSRSIQNLLFTLGGAVLVSMAATTSQATILNFDIDKVSPAGSPAANGGSMLTEHDSYGDHVTSSAMTSGAYVNNYEEGNGFTPDITTSYSLGAGASALRFYTGGDSAVSPNWKDVNFLPGGSPAIHYYSFDVTAPDTGIQVNSFDVFGYQSSLSHSFQWKLRADSTTGDILASGGPHTLTSSTMGSPFTVTTGQFPYLGSVVLEIDHLSGSGGAWGLDNINFDQVDLSVPEPSSLFAAALGLLGMLLRQSRRREGNGKV